MLGGLKGECTQLRDFLNLWLGPGDMKSSFEQRILKEVEAQVALSISTDLAARIAKLEEKFEQNIANLDDLFFKVEQLSEFHTQNADLAGLADRVANLEADVCARVACEVNGVGLPEWAKIESAQGQIASQMAGFTEMVDSLKLGLHDVQNVAAKAMNESECASSRCSTKDGSNCQPDFAALTEELRITMQKETKPYFRALEDSLQAQLAECQDKLRAEESFLMSEFVMNSNIQAEHLSEQLACQFADDMACSAVAEELAESSRHSRQLLQEMTTAMNNLDEPEIGIPIEDLTAESSTTRGASSVALLLQEDEEVHARDSTPTVSDCSQNVSNASKQCLLPLRSTPPLANTLLGCAWPLDKPQDVKELSHTLSTPESIDVRLSHQHGTASPPRRLVSTPSFPSLSRVLQGQVRFLPQRVQH